MSTESSPEPTSQPARRGPAIATRALLLTLLSAYAYVAFEWIFIATKPSALSLLSPAKQLMALFLSPLPLIGVAGTVLLFAALPAHVALRHAARTRIADLPLATVPALLMAVTIFLLIDNFTYTVFRFGVVSLRGGGRVIHTVLLLALLVASVRTARAWLADGAWLERRWTLALACGGALLSGSAAASYVGFDAGRYLTREDARHRGTDSSGASDSYPNVLLFSADGLDAARMSAYGSKRDTTPFIRSRLSEMLVFENHFTNSARTTGSVAALLSGKLPTTTRVIFRPDVFRGVHRYQHVPGLLRTHGFYNGDFSVRNYVDPRDLNLREGFHYGNGRRLDAGSLTLPRSAEQAYPSAAQFHDEVVERTASRVTHVLFLDTMPDPFREVTKPDRTGVTDRARMNDLKAFIRRAPRPFFAHVHLMVTHGSKFPVERQVFSRGHEQDETWDMDFYDDAILQYDRYVGEIFEFLRAEGALEDTIVVLNTDHGFAWNTHRPLPLMIRFPGAEHTGRRKVNSQRIDIAPTLLDQLGIAVPDWLEGRSLLSEGLSPLDPIYTVDRVASVTRDGWREVPSPQPPFFTLGSITTIRCQGLYGVDLRNGTFNVGRIDGHTARCQPLPDPRVVYREMIALLARSGYETDSLPPELPESAFRRVE